MTDRLDCDVAVVGGSLVGLAAAMFVARQGLAVIVIERRATVSDHPRARGLSVRTMELFRSAGIESAIREVGDGEFSMLIGDTLADDLRTTPRLDAGALSRLSPTTPYSCDQNRVEPILRDRAVQLGATMLAGRCASRVEQDAAGVTVHLSGENERAITARYVIVADGANGTLRDALGIGRHGQHLPGIGISVLFDADLGGALRGRHVGGLVSRQRGAVLFPKGEARERHWLGITPRLGLEGIDPDGLTALALTSIRAVVGDRALPISVCSALTWTTGAFVADRYRSGRAFLAGDAAHVMPPYGGFGGNTGIADAHNIAWKLAAVCTGVAPQALLDTYERERKPLAEFTVRHVVERGFGLQAPPRDAPDGRLDPIEISLGYRYPRTGPDTAGPLICDPARADGTPGMRVPHVPLLGASVSTLDLIDPTAFTFLTIDDGRTAAALRERPVTGVRLRTIDQRDVDDVAAFHRVFGDPPVGLLVRPDGIVGWRTRGPLSDPVDAVAQAYARCVEGHIL